MAAGYPTDYSQYYAAQGYPAGYPAAYPATAYPPTAGPADGHQQQTGDAAMSGYYQTPTGMYGQAPTAASGMYGQAPTAASGMYGQAPTAASGMYGQAPTAAGGMYGQAPTAAGGMYGQAPTAAGGAPSMYGQMPSPSMYGGAAMPYLSVPTAGGAASGYGQAPSSPRYGEVSAAELHAWYASFSPAAYGYGAPQCIEFKGKKRALLIGINYSRHRKGQLSGCINDVRNMSKFLMQNYEFPADQVVVLTDDESNPKLRATRANILSWISWLVKDAAAGDSFFFQFSGHGSQVVDKSGDEDDGYDETICPEDYDTAGMIIDDDLHAKMCMKVPPGARLTAIMDCCHSGTGLDLPYEYHPSGMAPVSGGGGGGDGKKGKKGKKDKKAKKKSKGGGGYGGPVQDGYLPGTTPGDCMLFSGCRDDQTSADATIGGKATGAMTWAFINCLGKNKKQTFLELLDNMRTELRKPPRTFTQVPQLSTGRPLNLAVPFSL